MSSQTTTNSDMKIYNDLAQTGYIERLQDNLDVFNVASRNTIQLISEIIPGDLKKSAFYKVGGDIEDRDVNSTADVDLKKISSGEAVSVKLPWRYGPYASTEEQFKRRARSVDEFAYVVGQDMADAVMKGWLNAAVSSLEGAIKSNAGMVVSGKTIAKDSRKALTAGLRKFGDKSDRVVAWVMNSATKFDFLDQAMDDKLYGEAGLVVYGGDSGTLNRPIIETDRCPEGLIFGLVAGAVTVVESQIPGVKLYDIVGKANFTLGYQGEGAYNVELHGYSWDEAAGGTNPAQSVLKTSANWDKFATDNKNTAGVLIDITATS